MKTSSPLGLPLPPSSSLSFFLPPSLEISPVLQGHSSAVQKIEGKNLLAAGLPSPKGFLKFRTPTTPPASLLFGHGPFLSALFFERLVRGGHGYPDYRLDPFPASPFHLFGLWIFPVFKPFPLGTPFRQTLFTVFVKYLLPEFSPFSQLPPSFQFPSIIEPSPLPNLKFPINGRS